MDHFESGQIAIEMRDDFLDHRLGDGQVVLPGSSLLLHSLLSTAGVLPALVEDFVLLKPVFLEELGNKDGPMQIQLHRQIESTDGKEGFFQVKVFKESPEAFGQPESPILMAQLAKEFSKRQYQSVKHHPNPPFPTTISHAQFYEFMCQQRGYQYGPAFRSVHSVEYGVCYELGRLCAWGRCHLSEEALQRGLDVQLDGLWQAMAFCLLKEAELKDEEDAEKKARPFLVPFSIGRLQFGQKLGPKLVKAEMYFLVHLEGASVGNFWILEEGEKLLIGEDLVFRPMALERQAQRPMDLADCSVGNEGSGKKKMFIRSMACRLPGDVNSPEQFWALLCQGKATDQRIPATRIPERNALIRGEYNGGNVPVEGGHFLKGDLAAFDAQFFGLSAMEAAAIDPMQRILLECVWECLDSGGSLSSPGQMAHCGFFVGFMGSEYADLAEQENAMQMLGSAASTVSGRLAHFFDSRGPAISIDTACSSSLVAMQLAVDAIAKRRCPRAVVGGVNLTLTAKGLVQRANGGMLSADGRCLAFDADANGYGRADGCVAILLEAVENDVDLAKVPHWAVVEAIETGHDGRSAALTAPNGLAQQELLERCLGQLSTSQKCLLRCWECHGTGTPLGDPVEFLALARALHEAKVPPAVLVGTAKANIGHTEAASGLVGVMKAALQLRHAQMPPLPNFNQLNGQIVQGMGQWGGESEQDNWPAKLAIKGGPLLSGNGASQQLLAGVSSFGVAGTLACAILSLDRVSHTSQVQMLRHNLRSHCSGEWQRILPLSANSEWSLEQMGRKHLKSMDGKNSWPIQAFCAVAALQRTHFTAFRSAIVWKEDGKVEIVKKSFTRIRFCLGFWPSFNAAFHEEVPIYRDAFRSLLDAIGAKEEEVLDNKSNQKLLLQLADTFARFRMLAKFGLIREEDEEGPKSGVDEAVGILRELLWIEGTLPRGKVLDCLEALERRSEPEKCHLPRGAASDYLLIGPSSSASSTASPPFASVESPSDLSWLLAHAHCLGFALPWATIFPVPSLALFSLLPLPNYPFERSKRFWSGRDAWKEVGWEHPLLGNQTMAREGMSQFEGLLSAKRAPWLELAGRFGIGAILEVLTAAGHFHFKCRRLSIRIHRMRPLEMSSGKDQWIRTEIREDGAKDVAKVSILAMDSGEELCQAEMKPFGKDGKNIGGNEEKKEQIEWNKGNGWAYSNQLGSGQQWPAHSSQLANGHLKISARRVDGNGNGEYLFNPILLETAFGQILATFGQHQGQESLPELLESIDLFLPEKLEEKEEEEDEAILQWKEVENLVEMLGKKGDLMMRAWLKGFDVPLKRNGQKADQNGEEEKKVPRKNPLPMANDANNNNAELTASIYRLLCSALPSGQLPPNWMDLSLLQLGLDSLALMALSQQLNLEFRLGKSGRGKAISPGQVFMAGRAGDLVDLVRRNGGIEADLDGNGRKGKGEKEKDEAENGQIEEKPKENGQENEGGGKAGAEQGKWKNGSDLQPEDDQKLQRFEEGDILEEALDEAIKEGVLDCIFEVKQHEKKPLAVHFWPDIHVQINQIGIEIGFLLKWPGIGEEKKLAFCMDEAEQFEESVTKLEETIFGGMEGEEVGLELALQLENEGKGRFHAFNSLEACSNGILLLSRAILHHLHANPLSVVRLRMAKTGDQLLLAFARTFLHNLQAECPQFQLVNAEEFRFKQLGKNTEKERKKPSRGSSSHVKRGKPRDTWLITGGTGGIGLEMANWLVEHRQLDCIFLLARNRPQSAHFSHCFSQMKRKCHVELLLCDVAEKGQMEAIFKRPEMLLLDGIVHSAGILLNAPITGMDPESMAQVVRTKAGGALLLDYLLEKHGLKPVHFLVNSTLASLHSSPGQAAYAAANAFCDELIRQRRAKGLAGSTLNWANWLEVGMAANRPGVNEQLRWLGLPGMSTKIALGCFGKALESRPVQWLCARFDWKRLQKQKGTLWGQFDLAKELEEVEKSQPAFQLEVPVHSEALPAVSSTNCPCNPGLDKLFAIIRHCLQEQLDGDQLESWTNFAEVGFMELGLDSLRLYQFANSLNKQLAYWGLRLSVLDLFERGTASRLAEFLRQKAGSEEGILKRRSQTISQEERNWPVLAAEGHRLNGRPLVPAAIQIQQFFEKISTKSNGQCQPQLASIRFNHKLWLDQWEGTILREEKCQLFLENKVEEECFSECSIEREDEANASSQYGQNDLEMATELEVANNGQEMDIAGFYSALRANGMDYGPRMQLIRSARVRTMARKAFVHARMEWHWKGGEQVPMPLWAHVEFALQALAIALYQQQKQGFFVPVAIERVQWMGLPQGNNMSFAIGTAMLDEEGHFARGNVKVFDGTDQHLLLQLDGILAQRITQEIKGKSREEVGDGDESRRTGTVLPNGLEEKREEEGKMPMAQWLHWVRPDQDLAILSASGTFSGCESIDQFWDALLQGRRCLSTLENANVNPLSLVPVSGICPNIEHFDLNLFASAGLSLAEWRRLDPQIRLLVQHAYLALERSGYSQRRGQIRVACFVGAEPSAPEYCQPDERESARGSLLGMHRRNQHSFAAQWISHLLGLLGPSVGVYSACSSSFSALAQARQALLCGDADLCLVVAVHLVLPSQMGHQPLPGQPLAKSAQSWPFCSQSEGILRGSACAVLALRRAKEAIEGADPVLAILKSIALANDAGKKASFMAPSVLGQREAIQLALAQAGVPKEAVLFWECHAAGTAMGDAIELEALHGAMFEGEMARKSPLLIGSAKASLGHCFAASGLCSVLKLVQMLAKKVAPPQPMPSGVQQPDLLLPFEGLLKVPGQMPAKLVPSPGHPLLVGATSFGIGGTNGALLLMEGPPEGLKGKLEEECGQEALIISCQYFFFPLSAASTKSLRQFSRKLAEYVQKKEVNSLDLLIRLSNTLQSRREHHRFRAFVLAKNCRELALELARIAGEGQNIVELEEGSRPKGGIGLFFGPQGVQFPGMFRAERQMSAFLDTQMRHFSAQLGPNSGLLQSLDSSAPIVHPPTAQTALFAVSQAIWAFLKEAGIAPKPDLSLGHSLGELSAFCAAGAFTAEEGIRLLWHRADLVQEGTAVAGMLMIRHGPGEQPCFSGLELCARLSPNCTVLLGPPALVESAAEQAVHQGISARILPLPNRGFHSAHWMGPILDAFEEAAGKMLNWRPLEGEVLSNADGRPVPRQNLQLIGPSYLREQMARPVRLDLCLETLLHKFSQVRVLLEIGPPGILRQLLADMAMAQGRSYIGQVEVIGTMRRDQGEGPPQLLSAIGQLWQNGFHVNFQRLFGYPTWQWDPEMPGYQLDRVQLNPNGQNERIVPFNGVEEKKEEGEEQKRVARIVAEVWHDSLSIKAIGTGNTDNLDFLLAGGNSLQAAQITWTLEKRLELPEGQLGLELLFKHPKMSDFVEAIWRLKNEGGEEAMKRRAEAIGQKPSAREDEAFLPLFLPLRPVPPEKARLHVFCIHPISGSALPYRQLAQMLPKWANVVGLQFAVDLEEIAMAKSLRELAEIYAEKIHGKCPEGPLLLMGHSLGGVLAREVAIVFNRQTKHAANIVVLFDSWALGQKWIWPEKVVQFVAERFAQFPSKQRDQLAGGAQKLAEFFHAHEFVHDPTNSPELWLFRASKKSKLPFSDFIDHSRDGGWARLTPRLNLVQCETDHEGILDSGCLRLCANILEAICDQSLQLEGC